MKAKMLAAVALGGVIGAIVFHTLYSNRNGSTGRPVATNKEVWEWTDWKGRERKITVHREVNTVA